MNKLVRGAAEKAKIILTIRDKAVLNNAYMPFLKNGGIFIANHTAYNIGEHVLMLLNLMDETKGIRVAGKVVWLARKGVKSPHVPGVGIQFIDPDSIARIKIETCLLGTASVATATM